MIEIGRRDQDPMLLLGGVRAVLAAGPVGDSGHATNCEASGPAGGLTLDPQPTPTAKAALDVASRLARRDAVLRPHIEATAALLDDDREIGGDCAGATPVRQLEAAAAIGEQGRAAKDPFALLAAARLTLAITGDARGGADDPWSVSSLLSDAARFGATEPGVGVLVDEMQMFGARGAVEGPSRLDELLKPHAVFRFTYRFAGEMLADAAVRVKPGLHGGDVALKVFDAEGKLIAEAVTRSDLGRSAYVDWRPKTCGDFVLEVRNLSDRVVPIRLNTAAAPADACPVAPDGKSQPGPAQTSNIDEQ